MALRGAIGASAFLVALPGLALGPQVELEFRPAGESSAVKSIEAVFELERGRMELAFEGSDGPFLVGGDGSLILVEQRLVFRDVYGAVDEGQVERLHRCLERLEIDAESEPCGERFEGFVFDIPSRAEEEHSPLEGACVVFAREEVSGELEVAYAEADRHREEELIRGLEPSVDFEGLLPGRAVAPGDRWTAQGSVITELIFPGGRIPFEIEGDDPREWIGDPRALVGDLEVELHGIAVRGGVALAELRVHGELEGETRWTAEEQYPFLFIGERPALVERVAETSCTIRGEMLWNVDLGRFDSASFAGDVGLVLTEDVEFEEGFELPTSIEWRGRFSLQATAEEPETEE